MEGTQRDPLADLERHRLRLEETVANLRKSLHHWHTWEFEYEALKEEIQRFKGQPSTEDMVKIGSAFGGDLVNEKEIKELIGYGKPVERDGAQVVNMISRRLDYVQQNAQTVQKQLDGAERKLEAALVLLEPDLADEEGLPLTDIHEELDEEGNVISSTLLHPSKTAPDVMDTLRKAGAIKAEDTLNPSSSVPPEPSNPGSSQKLGGSISEPHNDQDNKTDRTFPKESADSPKPILSNADRKPSSAKKSVAFAQDTAPRASSSNETSGTVHSGLEDDLAAFNFNRGEKVIELDENDKEVASYPIIPMTESPEDAALRREMLQYGLAEVNSVVAEIDLEEGDEEFSDLDDDYDGEYPETDDDEEEDEYGRTAHAVITDDYRKEMLELEKKLNARMLESIGPESEETAVPGSVEDVRRLVVQREEPEKKVVPTSTSGGRKKGVRFAEELDVSPAPAQAVPDKQQTARPLVDRAPLADAIIERKQPYSDHASTSSIEASKPVKVSRFKISRSGASVTHSTEHISTGTGTPASDATQSFNDSGEASGATLANRVVERNVVEDDIVPPNEDGLDPALLAQEVVIEYNKKRNRMIQDQGGFTPSAEDIESPLVEEIDGKDKKVSRFKASRLKSGGT
ncbi:uncharacterized protein BDZ99DRAFT_428276 [Mytilinidion resinicola]|uniref:DUF3835 domain-containing protein n=1 Tax=Mytilinidion resinicola TaxID=574789 RepID=A0A6A6Y3M8_9PEZI|nr:uncharacterized protein BDZ99DRAFT_428276 [Mytilinidion resinicola]KAF2802835.1 hypothetical protein BDZ99DRAFT_428276 [Mytilinidion resinicola]